jgi:hypothetical protein
VAFGVPLLSADGASYGLMLPAVSDLFGRRGRLWLQQQLQV